MSGSIFTDDGDEIRRLVLSAEMLVNRSIVAYGPSKSGKTVMIKHILDLLRGTVAQGFLVSPTEPANQSYQDYFPAPLIHYEMRGADPKNPKKLLEGKAGALQFLNSLWKRQEMQVQVYKQANEISILRKLQRRLPAKVRTEIAKVLAPMHKKMDSTIVKIKKRYASQPGEIVEKTRCATDTFEEAERRLIKNYVRQNLSALWQEPLTAPERNSIVYIDYNPHTVLILDDCGADLKPLMGTALFKNMFYRNRHIYLTVIFAFQDDTDLTANLRKNAFVSIFCDMTSAQTHFEQTGNRYSKDVKKKVQRMLPVIFAHRYRKLAYIRDDPRKQNFYHLTARPPDGRMFPSPAILEYCKEVERKGAMADTNNPYFRRFQVH